MTAAAVGYREVPLSGLIACPSPDELPQDCDVVCYRYSGDIARAATDLQVLNRRRGWRAGTIIDCTGQELSAATIACLRREGHVITSQPVPGCWLYNGPEVYRSVMHWLVAARAMEGVSGRINHDEHIYEIPIQVERLDWLGERVASPAIDVGCCAGWTTNLLGCQAGVDCHPDRIRYASVRYPHLSFYLADATSTTVPGAFRTIVLAEIVEHVLPEQAGHMIAMWMSSSGAERLLLTTPNAAKPGYDHDCVHSPEHVWFPTPELVGSLVPDGCRIYELGTTPGQDFVVADIRSR